MKRSIALLITLSFIIVVVLIVGKILNIYEKISNTGFEKSISQNSVLIKDIKKNLKDILKDINSSKDLKNIFVTLPVSMDDFRGVVTIRPLSDKLNLNLYKDKTKRKYIDIFLQNLFDYYNVADFYYFKNLLLDTFDSDNIERDSFTEIKNYDYTFNNGNIYSFNQFKKILIQYINYTNDKNILKIPWQKLIYFSDESTIIDCENMNKKFLKFYGINNCKEKNDIANALDIISYEKNRSYLIEIDVNYTLDNLKIVYNLNTKKAVVENNPLY